MSRLVIIGVVVATLGAGCGEGESAPPDAWASICGEPGDTGNELGIGKFCETLLDCGDTDDAPLCSNIGDEETWFCTKTCTTEGAGEVECGTDTTCTCGNGGCGCTPNMCLD